MLDHPNITKFYEVYKTKKGSLHIVMEFADDGDLQSKIKEKQSNLNENGEYDYWTEEHVLNIFT